MIQKIGERIYAVLTEEGFSSGNCIFIDDEPRVLIDSSAGKILSEINPESIDLLFNTHHHIDHVRGNHLFPNARILAHRKEHEAMKKPLKMAALEEWAELMVDHEIKDPVPVLAEFLPQIIEKWRVDEYIDEGYSLDLKHTRIEIYHTPGHTNGHCSFYFPREEILFTGDYCLTNAGPWYGDSDTTIDEFIASVERLISFNPKTLVTGHLKEPLYNDIEAMLLQYRDKIYSREEKIFNYLEKNEASIDEISKKHYIYKQHPTPLVLYWEKAMVKRHIERLIKYNKIIKTASEKFKAR